MKYMEMFQLKMFKKHAGMFLIYKYYKGESIMFKFIAKIAEKYAKATNTSCVMFWALHQPKMPASMIKKD